jgi:hypothetical protein
MAHPDFVICLECETPVYTFEWQDGLVTEAICATCGNDDPGAFATEEEFDEMSVPDDEGDEDE